MHPRRKRVADIALGLHAEAGVNGALERFQKTIGLLALQNLGAGGKFELFLRFPGFLLAEHTQAHPCSIVLDDFETGGIGAADRCRKLLPVNAVKNRLPAAEHLQLHLMDPKLVLATSRGLPDHQAQLPVREALALRVAHWFLLLGVCRAPRARCHKEEGSGCG